MPRYLKNNKDLVPNVKIEKSWIVVPIKKHKNMAGKPTETFLVQKRVADYIVELEGMIDGDLPEIPSYMHEEEETIEEDSGISEAVEIADLLHDSTGRAYPPHPHILDNWNKVYRKDGKLYRIVGDESHKEWEEVKKRKEETKEDSGWVPISEFSVEPEFL